MVYLQKGFVKKYWHYIILAIYFLLLIYQHNFIHMYGDDYYYGTFLKDDFLKKHLDHYMYINGRALVHFIVSLMLYYKTRLFMVVNPMMIIGVIVMTAKLTAKEEEDYKRAIVCGVILFSMLSINITRQSVFWLDGSFNYLFPILLSLSTFNLLKKSINTGKIYWYLPLLGLLAGMTVEQASAITFGGILLIILDSKYINKKGVRFSHYLTLGLAFIGGLTVFLAPGTFMRAEIEGTNVNIIRNIDNIYKMLFLYKDMEVYNLLLLVGIIFWLTLKKDKGFFGKVLLALSIFFFILILNMGGKYVDLMPIDFTNKMIFTIVIVEIFTFLLGLIYVGFYNLIIEKNAMVLISFILAIGAQLMMVVSPVYGYRILLCTIILYFIPIISTIIKFKDNRYIWYLMALILSLYIMSTKLLFVSLGVIIFEYINNNYNFTHWIKKINFTIVILIIGTATLLTVWKNIDGYRTNHSAHIYNESVIQQYLEGEKSGNNVIILKQMPLYDYGWSYPYENPYHMKVMKMYYGIDEEVQVIYQPWTQ